MRCATRKPRVIVAVPCFNEAENVPGLAQGFRQVAALMGGSIDFEAVFIDDASRDGTHRIVESEARVSQEGLEIKLLRHEKNLGLTGGIRTAFEYFYQAIVDNPAIAACALLDGDNSHHPGHLAQMIPRIFQGFDVVVCSRYQPGSCTLGVVWWRRLLSAGMSLLFRTVGRLPGVRDYSCGFRAYSPSLCARLWKKHGSQIVTEESFACMVELLVNCYRCGAIMTEIPMLLRYDLKQGASKMQFRRTVVGTLRVLLNR